jgi:hypothetical protein
VNHPGHRVVVPRVLINQDPWENLYPALKWRRAMPKSGLAPSAQKKAARAITVRLFPQLPAP